ncbi:MAG: hypothetical protein LBD11_03690 [Candidatus Peribacteria bacterium]|nr:hypothetical protein [Candidatus Peribacteria bacterium]
MDGPSTAWNGDAKKCMDALVSLELSKSLQANLGSIEELVEGINTTLSNAFPMMSCILKKYPFVTKNSIPSDSPLYPQLQDTLRQYRSITINPIYDSAKKTEKLAEVQKDFDTLYREAYVLQIRTDDPLLADSLKEV